MGGFMTKNTYVAENYLVWHQWEGWHLVLLRLDTPEKGILEGLDGSGWVGRGKSWASGMGEQEGDNT